MAETYYEAGKSDPITCYQRLFQELSEKQYFTDQAYSMYLSENGLDGNKIYNKDTDYKRLLKTVYDILEALSNDIDLFRSVQTEFVTTSQAYQYLEHRLERLERRIDSIPDDINEAGTKSVFSFIFKD